MYSIVRHISLQIIPGVNCNSVNENNIHVRNKYSAFLSGDLNQINLDVTLIVYLAAAYIIER